jgi:hypothetical protein
MCISGQIIHESKPHLLSHILLDIWFQKWLNWKLYGSYGEKIEQLIEHLTATGGLML